jgi:NAD(P)-dependent dehydrogenase (short-subunit alcohol dehydrogenase family)
LAATHRIRVNCLVPDWVATPEVQGYVDAIAPDQRRAHGVPEKLTTVDEIAEAVLELATARQLAGRVLVWWSGHPKRLIPAGDLGYADLEEST